MLRGIWQRVKDTIYDSVLSVFRTQEEIDEVIEDRLSQYGLIVDSALDIPTSAKMRNKLFWTEEDLIKYITDGAIPAGACFILRLPEWDDEGNTAYKLYVSPNSDEHS